MVRLRWRVADEADTSQIIDLQNYSIEELQKPFLSPAQIESSKKTMGLDRQLIADKTYFIIESDEVFAGCGGWGRRATLFGGSHSAGRSDAFLDPSSEPARIRAMYASPDFKRRGIGSLLLALGELAASEEGFGEMTLGATLAGEPLYKAAGFREVDRYEDASNDGSMVPVITMVKPIERDKAIGVIEAATGEALGTTIERFAAARAAANR